MMRHDAVSWPHVRRGMAVLFGISFVALFTAGVLRAQLGPLLSERATWQGALVGAAFVAVGSFVMLESGQRVNGALMAAFGVGYWLSQLGPLVSSTGVALLLTLANYLPWVCLGLVLLRYPERRLERGYGRAFIFVVVAWLVIWQAVAVFTWPPRGVSGYDSAQWPLWLPNYELNSFALRALEWGSAAFGAGFLVLMTLRVVRTRGMDRQIYLPVYLATSAAAVVVLSNLVADIGAYHAPLRWLERVALLVIAAALLLAALRRRLARLRVADLVLRVTAAAEPAEVQNALRRTMADRSLTVLFWSADLAEYIDVEGRPSSEVDSGKRLALKVTDRSGGPLAIVLADPSAVHHRELVTSALAASALALENAALHASLLARLADVRESRARIVAAGDAERRRLERDLHDGAQQHLVAIAVKLRVVRDAVEDDPADALAVLDELKTDVQDTIQALRALAHGIFPPLLASGGLCEALPAAAARAGLPTDVEIVGVGRYPAQVETAVYFCCLEALQNAGKHAGMGASATLRVWEDPGSLRFEVADNGVGIEPALGAWVSGHGFINMSDRLGAVGGLLDVHASPGGGVRVAGVIPLE
ncbi:MAG TPA: histidine kinase [Jiangellaceae bacterium]|nr:histidine kinase [Jiangellaceae bacterium]